MEKRLRAQYTALDRQMASLNSLSNYVTQQLSVLNSSSKDN
jgi:flagellar hook-associated protein 2